MANTHSATLASASSQYFTAVDSASLSITGDMTLECWIKLTTGTQGSVLTKRNSDTSQRSFSFQASSTALVFGCTSTGGAVTDVTISTAINTGTWYHIAVVYTASAGSAKFYKDGVQVGSTQTGLPTSIYDSTSVFAIGTLFTPAQDFINAQIDEVRVWNIVRSATEINDTKSLSIDSATNLQGSWHLNNALTDSSGNSNTLTNVNSAAFTTDIPYTDPAVVAAALFMGINF